ncbi:MAG TPA: hypothetical protein VEF03_06625 [Candidatus Binataceae bacterium]|nr:hypothetical protein [Candidatus Binataceae bacterium]
MKRGANTGLIAAAGVFLFAGAMAGCGAVGGSHVDCNIVRLQSQAGQSNAQIASALGVSESDVVGCHAPGPESMPPAQMGGGEAPAAGEAAPSSEATSGGPSSGATP